MENVTCSGGEAVLFLEHHRLEDNPFLPEAVRPWLASHSAHQAARKLDRVLANQLHCLFLSGPPGVGKSTLVGQRLRELKQGDICWVKPGLENRELLLAQLIGDLGLGVIDGTITELRRIVEVFLRHQAGNGQPTFIVADGLERLSVPVLRELESIGQLRLKHRPIVHLILLTRNDDLVSNLLPQLDGGRFAPVAHQRLTGFTLDETQTYLHACLQGAGCSWPDDLLPPDVVVDVQAFTHGVVGDINALCRQVLDRLAERPRHADRPPRVTRALLKETANALHLRYDPGPWERAEAELSAEAVRVSDPAELRIEAARLVVSSGGRQVADIVLDRPRMVLGRDSTCDISLDSRYVSRYQNLFMETGEGWVLIDLNSTNGCFVNGRRVREHHLHDGDLIAVGQHQLRFRSATAQQAQGITGSDEMVTSGEETLVSPTPILGGRPVS